MQVFQNTSQLLTGVSLTLAVGFVLADSYKTMHPLLLGTGLVCLVVGCVGTYLKVQEWWQNRKKEEPK